MFYQTLFIASKSRLVVFINKTKKLHFVKIDNKTEQGKFNLNRYNNFFIEAMVFLTQN